MQTTKRIMLGVGCDLLMFKERKYFEVKIIDNFTGVSLIIDNSYMNKKALSLKDYIPLCNKIIDRLLSGAKLEDLSLQ